MTLMLDWGVFGPEDNDLTFEDCVVKILPRMARKVLETSGASELTLLGYFTSEIGSKQARRYVAVPGRFEGCIPYKKGDKAFA